MSAASWEDRIRTLNRSGYARFDERTAGMLGDTASFLVERHGGDLRRLREEGRRDPGRERTLLRECKGIGDVGVDISFRDAHVAWDELTAARRLRLGGDAAALGRLASHRDLLRLVAALVRADLEDDGADVLALAG